MSPPPHRRERGDRPEREPIDPMQALEHLYAKKVITLEEGQAAAQLIAPGSTFPPPPKPPPAEAPVEPPAEQAESPPPDEGSAGNGAGTPPTDVPSE